MSMANFGTWRAGDEIEDGRLEGDGQRHGVGLRRCLPHQSGNLNEMPGVANTSAASKASRWAGRQSFTCGLVQLSDIDKRFRSIGRNDVTGFVSSLQEYAAATQGTGDSGSRPEMRSGGRDLGMSAP